MKHIVFYASGFTYQYNPKTGTDEQVEVNARNSLSYSEANLSVARERACNGEYTIADDSPEAYPTGWYEYSK